MLPPTHIPILQTFCVKWRISTPVLVLTPEKAMKIIKSAEFKSNPHSSHLQSETVPRQPQIFIFKNIFDLTNWLDIETHTLENVLVMSIKWPIRNILTFASNLCPQIKRMMPELDEISIKVK